MKIRSLVSGAILIIIQLFVFNAGAQMNTITHFGDNSQPGTRLHKNISNIQTQGYEAQQAVSFSVAQSITGEDNTLTIDAKSAVAFDIPLSESFYNEMVETNSLIDVTKVLVETFPEKIVQVVTLGITLYPEFAQEVFDGAALTGVLSADDILVIALQAGADPSLISTATAAGGVVTADVIAIPLGAGIGAGGTGGGDTTVSTN